MNFLTPVRWTVRRAPELPLLVDGELTWTYAQAWGVFLRTAALLERWGLAPGDRVLVWLPNGAEFLAVVLGYYVDNGEQMYDYLCAPYPAGLDDPSHTIFANSDAIVEVVSHGYLDEQGEEVLKAAVEMMNADHGVVLLKEDGNLRTMVSHGIPPDSTDSLTELSSSVVNQVIDSGAPLLTHDARSDPRFGDASSIILHQITSIICVPMYLGMTL